jgi:hypothetical protein
MSVLSEIVGSKGAFETLRDLETRTSTTSFDPAEIASVMIRWGVNNPDALIHDFVASNLLHLYGEKYALTSAGSRTYLLLEAINGGDIKDVFRRLSRLDPGLSAYELVREGMTTLFLQNLNERPGFARLYVCSPWISFSKRELGLLMSAIARRTRRDAEVEIFVITRPQQRASGSVPTSVQPLEELGATVYLAPRLHTKLYIREPDSSGGYSMAILGSQNLTRSSYLELGIRINSDSRMIDRLIGYFWDITNQSYER